MHSLSIRVEAPARRRSSKSRIVNLDLLPATAVLTRQELAECSGFAVVTLRLWNRQGRGPKCITVEGRPRYRVDEVRRWLAGSAAA